MARSRQCCSAARRLRPCGSHGAGAAAVKASTGAKAIAVGADGVALTHIQRIAVLLRALYRLAGQR